MTEPKDSFGVPFQLEGEMQQAAAAADESIASIGRKLAEARELLGSQPESWQAWLRYSYRLSTEEAEALIDFARLLAEPPTSEQRSRLQGLRGTALDVFFKSAVPPEMYREYRRRIAEEAGGEDR